MASSKSLEITLCLALLLVVSLVPGSEGCWAEGSYNDSQHLAQLHKVSRYSFFQGNPKWPPSKYHLNYKFLAGFPPNGIPAVAAAFNEWDSKSHFTFSQVADNAPADITVGFLRQSHGDGYPFDGQGGVLAHAFAPQDGRMHFDADDRFSLNAAPNTFDLQSVAVHEIGHILGLGHSNDQNAIMFPSISSGTAKRILQADDINGIKALYGM